VTIDRARVARIGVLLCAGTVVVAAGACARAHGMLPRARVPGGSVTGRAAEAVGDSGIFASPVLPAGVRPVIPHADAESAAVAMGYWEAPSVQDRTVPYYHEIPTERRHFCGRSYYVRPVVAMPDTTVVQTHTGNDWMMWAPTWVIPICDDAGSVRSSVHFTDLPTGLHVIQGPGAHDVPELAPDSASFPHLGEWPAKFMRDWEHGIGMTPERAVSVAAARLGRTGARVTEVPEAFTMVRRLPPQPPGMPSARIVADLAICPRWRLTLDRPVTLRGTTSGQVVRTEVVYVSRRTDGCHGDPVLQIPLPTQPATIPFVYYISHRPPPGTRIVAPPPPDDHWTTLRVVEPLWFEEARLRP
jgi:hypothetical protein